MRTQSIVLGWIPAFIGGSALTFFDLFKEIVEIGNARYGLQYQKKTNPPHFSEMPKDPASRERYTNIQRWHPWTPEQAGSLLLVGVYSHNYLSNAHLDAPFGKTAMTLREWIESEPSERGELKPFTNTLTEWTPTRENIPEIREQLFRAGRLFYWRFWETVLRPRRPGEPLDPRDPKNHLPGPYYRSDIHAPWEATDPIPEIFRAELNKNADPRVVLD